MLECLSHHGRDGIVIETASTSHAFTDQIIPPATFDSGALLPSADLSFVVFGPPSQVKSEIKKMWVEEKRPAGCNKNLNLAS